MHNNWEYDITIDCNNQSNDNISYILYIVYNNILYNNINISDYI